MTIGWGAMAGRRSRLRLNRVLASFAVTCAVVVGLDPRPAWAGEPGAYATFDTVFLQRWNRASNQPLVFDGAAVDAPAVISGRDMHFAVQPGIRLFVGDVDDCGRGWEVGYLGVWGMFAAAEATGPGTLRAPDPLALQPNVGLNDASFARATYSSTLNSAEANVFLREADTGYDRRSGRPWQRCEGYVAGQVDWLVGFRWAGLDESASVSYAPAAPPLPTTYGVRSSSNLFGAQLGTRGRMEWERWAVEGWAKTVLTGAERSQSQAPIIDALDGGEIRSAGASRDGGVGFIGDLSASVIYKLSDTWGLRAGYNLLWISGVALAPDQLDFAALPAGSTAISANSSAFLHGANLGLEARW
jgi:hypothetical protein